MDNEEVSICVTEIKTDIKWIKENIENLDKRYAPREPFETVKSIVYGLVTLIMLSVGTAIVASVVRAAAISIT